MRPLILLSLTLFTSLATPATIPINSGEKDIKDKPEWHLSKRQFPNLPPAGQPPNIPAGQFGQGQRWAPDPAPPGGRTDSNFPTPSTQSPDAGGGNEADSPPFHPQKGPDQNSDPAVNESTPKGQPTASPTEQPPTPNGNGPELPSQRGYDPSDSSGPGSPGN